MTQNVLSTPPPPQKPAGDGPNNNTIRWKGLRQDRASADHRTTTDSNSLENNDACADPNVILDDNFRLVFWATLLAVIDETAYARYIVIIRPD
jgi:hypothetical protein